MAEAITPSFAPCEIAGKFPALEHTRLVKLYIEALQSPDVAPKGNLIIEYNSEGGLSEDLASVICRASVTAKGQFQQDDSGEFQDAFTADCVIEGVFRLAEPFVDMVKLSTDDVHFLANYLNPLLADAVEVNLSRTGYGKVTMERSVMPSDEAAES